ncbi:segregation and condensation protein A [Agathobacter sp.]
MDMTIKLQVFEGPLDLLLYLIEKNKVNIYDIPIVDITAQYMEYVAEMQRRDLDVLSEFLVMAATLIDIKSKMLLPKNQEEDEEEEDPRAELVQQLLEYKMYKCIAYELKDRQLDADKVWFKEPTIPDEVREYEPPVDLDELVSGLTLSKLNDIFQSIMKKQADKIDKVRAQFGKIEKEEVSLEEKMDYLTDFATTHRHFSFRGLLEKSSSKVEVIVTFLAILELMKTGKIIISQEHIFDDIKIESQIAA